jgi:hypothetical protein
MAIAPQVSDDSGPMGYGLVMTRAILTLILCCGLAAAPPVGFAWPTLDPAAGPKGSGPTFQCQDLSAPPLNANADWASQVFPALEGCAACHLSEFPNSRIKIVPGSPELTLIDLLDPAADLVLALRPRDSALMKRLNCDRLDQQEWRMPRCFVPPCNYWSAAQQALVYDWIAQGARGDFDGSPQSDIVFLSGVEGSRL